MMFYLASPYASEDENTRLHRVAEVTRIAAAMMNVGYWTFSPVVHNHQLRLAGTDLKHAQWLDFDERILEHCDVVVVLTLPGWQTSKGVQAEIAMAERHRKPVVYINPKQLIIKSRTIFRSSP